MFMWKTSKGNKVILIKVGITNCYFIEYGEICILVDTGQKKDSIKLLNSLKPYLGDTRNLNYLVFTHTHYDHSGNAKAVKNELAPKIIVHEHEAMFLKNGFTRLPKGTNVFTWLMSWSGNKYAKWIGEYDAVKPDIQINGTCFINELQGLQILETPGHTCGSVSLIVDNEIAIVGDTLFGVVSRKVYPPFADDKYELFRSWKKLLQTPCRLFLPGHGKAIKRDLLERELKRKIKS